jgi:Tol biopolymer transport system component/serine/threonine protein kinase
LHRDLKPGNVKITPDGHIFLVDFGLAKVLHGNQATTTGARAMTPGYSPPEQYGTARTDPRTDIYSLGATLYAALSGIIPEDGLARAMDNTQLTPLRKRNSKVSRRLASSIEKAMGIDPAERFQYADDFKHSLLGSKAKTQRLPGDYVIQAPPSERADPSQLSAIEKASAPVGESRNSGISGLRPGEEAPVFKPPRRKRKGLLRRLFASVLILVLLLASALVGFVRFRPDLVPAEAMGMLESFSIPFLLPPTPTPTETVLPTVTSLATESSVFTPSLVPATAPRTPTTVPTATTQPTLPTTATTNAIVPGAPTSIGGSAGQIAFASSRSGTSQIYLINVDGTNLLQITNIEEGACQPAWSPEGSQLVFISPCRGRNDFFQRGYTDSSLYLMNVDGTDVTRLTNVPGADFEPAWSPNGQRIAFTSLRDGNKQIYVLDIDSLVVTRLTTPDVNVENSQPAWSPFGDRIVYLVKRVGTYQVWAMNDIGQENVQLVRSGQTLWDFAPTWSPDGNVILYSQRRTTGFSPPWLMSIQYADGGNATRLNFPAPIEDVEYSPDGLWLVSEGMDSSGDNRDVYFMTITGSSRTRLTDDPADDFDPTWRPAPTP